MPQQNTTTGGTATPAAHAVGKEVTLSADAKVKELGDNKVEVEMDGAKFIGRRQPNGRIIRDS